MYRDYSLFFILYRTILYSDAPLLLFSSFRSVLPFASPSLLKHDHHNTPFDNHKHPDEAFRSKFSKPELLFASASDQRCTLFLTADNIPLRRYSLPDDKMNDPGSSVLLGLKNYCSVS